MEKGHKDGFGAAVFGLAAGLLIFVIWGELSAVPMAFALCTLTAFICGRFGRWWGFVPAAVGAAAALLMQEEFIAECSFAADETAYLLAYRTKGLYRPFEGAADSAPLIMLIAVGIFCVVYSAVGIRGFAVFAALFSAAWGALTGGSSTAVCLAVGLSVGILCFGVRDKRSAVLVLCTAVMALPAAFIRLPEIHLDGEVTASGGLPLYLAQETRQPYISKETYARCSAIYEALYEHGFYPQQQTAYLLEAAGETFDADKVTVGGGLVPQGVCEGEPDEISLGGFKSGDFTVYRQLPENVFTLLPELQDGDYIDCEGLYRECVYACYGSLTADEAQEMEQRFSIDGSLPLDKKLEAVKAAVSSEYGKGSTDEDELTELTVRAAKSCGIAARQVRGVYFPVFPESGRAKLSDGIYRSWAEVYIDGAGWVTLETSPEYEGYSPLLPESAENGDETSITEREEKLIYKVSPPRTAAEIIPENEEKKPDGHLLACTLATAAAALAALVTAGRIRAGIRRHKRGLSVGAAHFQGRELMAKAVGAGEVSPERFYELVSEKMGSAAAESFAASEKIYERIRFSSNADESAEDRAVSQHFYETAKGCMKSLSVGKRLTMWLKGKY